MNLILEQNDQIPWLTNMRLVLAALGISASDYDWCVSDVETNYFVDDLRNEDQWMEGRALQEFLERKEIQFIWAVFSAVPKGYRCNAPLPYADGNAEYWSGREIRPQLEGALFVITCWDSSATILVGLPAELESNFRRAYPDARSLASVGHMKTEHR